MPRVGLREILFGSAAFALGVWAFVKTNQVSGPTFQPILEACTDSSIPIEEFAEKTGYHYYEPKVGFGVLNFLVCLITQFLLELRNTYPAGVLVWGGVLLVSLPVAVLSPVEAGRTGARGPIRYPVIVGLLHQLFGISVVFPLVWVPAYIFGRGYGAVTVSRAYISMFFALPGLILSMLVFTANTDSYLWTVCAGTLGGPLLPMIGVVLLGDKPPSIESNDALKKGATASSRAYLATAPIAFVAWITLVYIAFTSYGTDVVALWNDIWKNSNASVAFMTIDTIVLFVGILMYIAYRDWSAAIKSILLTPCLGPGAACSLIMAEIEAKSSSVPPTAADDKKKS